MNVLIACEFSGIIREAFKDKGHNAWSCDLLDSEIKGNHFIDMVQNKLNLGWDLMIAHPPCTHLAVSGARWFKDKKEEQQIAIDFFMLLINAPIKKICVENPVSSLIFKMPPFSQEIQPYQFGNPYSKKTRLWLKGLPELKPTRILKKYRTFMPSNTGGAKRGQHHLSGIPKNNIESSKTFQGIADAMAEQWG